MIKAPKHIQFSQDNNSIQIILEMPYANKSNLGKNI